ncbi:hypothetical protein NIES2100_64200 [Calothrix sp. NIES-2100]|uniref:hypothetical protein n=1 Tax=Calothrix sp. NIES-2100 TaxID=1954172 RepID=UPI000B5E25DF|nr:hypothetical protein NIES2100_64200 [Calothrix sp. NIES-2100]
MSDTSQSRSLIVGHDLFDDEETYLHDLSKEELSSLSGGALKKTGPMTTAINCTVPAPTKTVATTAISCTCHPGPQPTPPVVIDPCPKPITTAWFCTLY